MTKVKVKIKRTILKTVLLHENFGPTTIPRGYSVISVGDKWFNGWCECCLCPILEGEKYGSDPDGDCIICHECCDALGMEAGEP